jgi:hypothetical protein
MCDWDDAVVMDERIPQREEVVDAQTDSTHQRLETSGDSGSVLVYPHDEPEEVVGRHIDRDPVVERTAVVDEIGTPRLVHEVDGLAVLAKRDQRYPMRDTEDMGVEPGTHDDVHLTEERVGVKHGIATRRGDMNTVFPVKELEDVGVQHTIVLSVFSGIRAKGDEVDVEVIQELSNGLAHGDHEIDVLRLETHLEEGSCERQTEPWSVIRWW